MLQYLFYIVESFIIISHAFFELLKEKHYDECKYNIKMSTGSNKLIKIFLNEKIIKI